MALQCRRARRAFMPRNGSKRKGGPRRKWSREERDAHFAVKRAIGDAKGTGDFAAVREALAEWLRASS